MRLTGPRRGNPTVRFMVEQVARRRMWSASGGRGRDVGAEPEREGAERRWGREFFEQLRDTWLWRMAHVADTADGELRYFGSRAFCVWAFVAPHATALAYEYAETPSQIRERARRWLACLMSRTAPGLASPHWGHPVYGARVDPLSGELDVVWAVPGDWCDAVLSGTFPTREWDAPPAWAVEPELAPA